MNPTMAQDLAESLIRELAPPGWRFAWSYARTQLGLCEYGPLTAAGKPLTRTIRLSRPLTLINDEAIVRETILHEIAHALAGPKANHGKLWKAHARALGIKNPRHCIPNANHIEGNVIATCPECGVGYRAHKITYAAANTQACAPCYDKGKVVRFTFTRPDGTPIDTSTLKKPKKRRRARRRPR